MRTWSSCTPYRCYRVWYIFIPRGSSTEMSSQKVSGMKSTQAYIRHPARSELNDQIRGLWSGEGHRQGEQNDGEDSSDQDKSAWRGWTGRDELLGGYTDVGRFLRREYSLTRFRYMAPEVIRASEKAGHLGSADIWSMGCVLLEISTGYANFYMICLILMHRSDGNHGAISTTNGPSCSISVSRLNIPLFPSQASYLKPVSSLSSYA